MGDPRVGVRWGNGAVAKVCKETSTGIGQCNTACGGDDQGPWCGWDHPLTTQMRSSSVWLWLLSLPLRPMRRDQCLATPGHCWLLTHPYRAWEVSHCSPALNIPHPTSHCSKEKPRTGCEATDPHAQGMGIRAWLSYFAKDVKAFHSHTPHLIFHL